MKNKSLIITTVALVAVIALAAIAYPKLSQKAENDAATSNETTTTVNIQEINSETYEKYKDVSFYDKNGNVVMLSDFFGKPVLINFWATWCGYCVAELPDFNEAYEKYKDEVQFIFINPDESTRTGEAFMSNNGFDLPTYYDLDRKAGIAFNARSYPLTIAFDENGNIHYMRAGMINAVTIENIIMSII